MQDQFQLEKIGNSITISKPFMAGFSLDPLDMGGGIWVDKCREESVNGGGGGLMRGDMDIMGGPNFDRLYHKLKVLQLLLLLLCY